MKSVSVVEAKAHFSALLAEVEAGSAIAVTRHGKVIARMVPEQEESALDAIRDLLVDNGIPFDMDEPADPLPKDVTF